MSFELLELNSALIKKLNDEGFSKPFEIQQKAIPLILKNKDLLGIAATGSGKTASYVLPLLSKLELHSNVKDRKIKVLVLVPTRELAVQVNEVFQLFASALTSPVKTMAVFGGVSINPQMKKLFGTQILVATPGRLLELANSNAVHFSDVETLVLDEADKMLNLGFKEEMEQIFKLLPPKRQNLLFSATLNKNLESLNQLVLTNPLVVKIKPKQDNIDLINQIAYSVSDERKGPLLRYLIKTQELKQVLVFVSSIKRADNVANKLRANGIDAWPIHSKKSQGARTDLITKFKYGKLRVLVATDLLARGIDIDFLPCVVNYELPRSPKDYIHRIGRTGRANNPGKAMVLITPNEHHHFKVIQKKMGKAIDLIDSNDFNLKGY